MTSELQGEGTVQRAPIVSAWTDRLLRVRDERGTSLVEMAISLSVLLAILFGIVEISTAVYTFHSISDAAREACRYAVVRGSQCTGFADCGIDGAGLQTVVRGMGFPFVQPSNLTVNAQWYTAAWDTTVTPATTSWSACGTTPAGCNVPGNQVEVQVVYNFPIAIPFWQANTIRMASTARMVISQ